MIDCDAFIIWYSCPSLNYRKASPFSLVECLDHLESKNYEYEYDLILNICGCLIGRVISLPFTVVFNLYKEVNKK
jgi:hypothetical protein